MNGCIYRTKDNECDLYSEGGKYSAFCDLENCNERKPSNADRIRSMTDEELAKELEWIDDTACAFNRPRTYEGWLEWLKKEAE